MSVPKLSICIPTFNRPQCLMERLEQLATLDLFFTEIFQLYWSVPQNRDLILNHIKSL